MGKLYWKPGNMLYPLPVVMVSVADKEGNSDIVTVAWAGTICTNPPMVSISVRPERFSHHMLMETGEFVINLTTKELAFATDYCGVKSGRDVDKWKEMNLTPVMGNVVKVPCIAESPVNIECKVVKVEKLGSHDMFVAEVVAVQVDDAYMDVVKANLTMNNKYIEIDEDSFKEAFDSIGLDDLLKEKIMSRLTDAFRGNNHFIKLRFSSKHLRNSFVVFNHTFFNVVANNTVV